LALRLGNRRRLLEVASRYFEPEELASAEVGARRLRVGQAEFGVSRDGQRLIVRKVPDDSWLRDHVQALEDEERTWAVVAYLKVRTINDPDEVIRRARTGELYDENYFTKRGGGGPYIDYPLQSEGETETERRAIADETAARNPGRVLDLGAATGVLVKDLEDRGVEAAGIDISDWAIENRLTDSVVKGTALDLPFEDESFDTIISQDFMEHVHPDDMAKVLAEQVRVTRPGGHLLHLIPFYDADEPFQLDAHLCQANRGWWIKMFEQTPGIKVSRPDKGPEAKKMLDRHVELIRL
jgi:SAM-dependent methyltransferase